jgi:Flp pilus assembly pilin Flp
MDQQEQERRQQLAQGLVEYGLVLVLVSIVAIAMIAVFGGQVNNLFSTVISAM